MGQYGLQNGLGSVLDQDVGCPECGYNLRGLGNDLVECPECGKTSDVALLAVRRWDKPWYKAPGYSQLCMPTAAAFLSFIGWGLSIVMIEAADSDISYASVGAVWLAIGLIGWSSAMAWVWNKFDKHISAGFALLTHLTLIGYIGGLIFMLFGALTFFLLLADGKAAYVDADLGSIAIYTSCLIGGVLGLFGARLVERLAAKHCIRLYLRLPTTSG